MKKRKTKRKRIRIVHIFLLFLVVYVMAIMINQRKLTKSLQAKREELEGEIAILEGDIKKLNNQIDSSDSLEFVEKVAREDLGMVKPREIIYIDKKKVEKSIFNIFDKDTN